MFRRKLKKIGRNNRISRSIVLRNPIKICIGSNCLISRGVTLDARSKTEGIRIDNDVNIKDLTAIKCYGGDISIGENVIINRCCTIHGHGNVCIGANSMIGPNVVIVTSNYGIDIGKGVFKNQGETREPVFIGENVWIGANSTILPGAKINNNVVIGAGSVVRGICEEGYLYAGVPVKKKKSLKLEINKELFRKDWKTEF